MLVFRVAIYIYICMYYSKLRVVAESVLRNCWHAYVDFALPPVQRACWPMLLTQSVRTAGALGSLKIRYASFCMTWQQS